MIKTEAGVLAGGETVKEKAGEENKGQAVSGIGGDGDVAMSDGGGGAMEI